MPERRVWICLIYIFYNLCARFLAYRFGMGFKYFTINSSRLAISVNHDYVDNDPVGPHPKVSAFMKDAFNANPLKPKYILIWNKIKVLS